MMRVANRLVLLILGAALAAGGALVIIEAIWTWTDSGFVWIPGRQWLTSFKTTAWSNSEVIAISIGVAVVGLLLLLAQLRPHQQRVARFQTERGTWLLLRRSTEAHIVRRLRSAAPIKVKARFDPQPRQWSLKVAAAAPNSDRPDLEAVARRELEHLRAPDVRLRVKTTGAPKA